MRKEVKININININTNKSLINIYTNAIIVLLNKKQAHNKSYYLFYLQREKKQIQLKINYISQINNLGENEKQVEQIIQNLSQPEVNTKTDYILCDDISKQKSDFKDRLEAKRRRKTVTVK